MANLFLDTLQYIHTSELKQVIGILLFHLHILNDDKNSNIECKYTIYIK